MTAALDLDLAHEFNRELAAVIRDRLFRKGLKVYDLAPWMRCSKQSVSGKLNGRVGITTAELFGIAAALDTTPADLLEAVGEAVHAAGWWEPVVRQQGLEPRTR